MTWIKAFRREATVGIAPHARMSGTHLFRGDKCPRCRCPRRDRARRRRGAAFPGATPQLSRGNAFRPCARVCAPPYPPQRWRTLPLPWVDQRASARKVVHIWYYIWVITNSRRKRRERSSCFPSRRTPLPSFAGRNLSGLSWLLVEQRSPEGIEYLARNRMGARFWRFWWHQVPTKIPTKTEACRYVARLLRASAWSRIVRGNSESSSRLWVSRDGSAWGREQSTAP